MRYCPDCGTRLEDNEEYCPHCGLRQAPPVFTEEPPEFNETPPVFDDFDDGKEDFYAEPRKSKFELQTFGGKETYAEEQVEKKERIDNRLLLVIILSGIVGALLILFIWFFFLKEPSGSINWESTPQTELEEEEEYTLPNVENLATLTDQQLTTDDAQSDEEEQLQEEGAEPQEDSVSQENTENKSVKYFTGTVGGQYPVKMMLDASTGNGKYVIVKDGVTRTMNVSFKMQPDGFITINEYTPDGEFTGEWEGTLNNGAFSGEGNVQGSDLPFNLRESSRSEAGF